MPTDLPPASITGQQGWEWNELQAKQEPHDSPSSSANRSDEHTVSARRRERRRSSLSHRDPDRCHRRTDAPRRELAAAVQRKERRLQRVIDHYERVIEQKNRKLAKHRETASSGRLPPFLSSLLEYFSR